MNAEQPNCLILNAGADNSFATDLQAMLTSVVKTDLIHLFEKNSSQVHPFSTLTLDVVSLKDQLENVDYIVFLPRIPMWSERLSDLINADYQSLSNVLNIALQSRVKKMVFVSDVEAMGSSLRPAVVNEDSLWSGQTKANEVQKYWYLCEQEIARAREEGLNANIIAASQMPALKTEEKIQYYATDRNQLAKSLIGVLLSDLSAFKIFCVEALDSSAVKKEESTTSLFGKWFGHKRKPINKLTIDATNSKAIIDAFINQ